MKGGRFLNTRMRGAAYSSRIGADEPKAKGKYSVAHGTDACETSAYPERAKGNTKSVENSRCRHDLCNSPRKRGAK